MNQIQLMQTELLPCPDCGDEQTFAQPPCAEGHELGACPEWACIECGAALWIGWAEGEPEPAVLTVRAA